MVDLIGEMKRLLIIAAIVAAFIVSVASASAVSTVRVFMHDPGCHAFMKGHSYVKSMTAAGPVRLVNYDEASLIVKGPRGTKTDAVGAGVILGKGVYHIIMVHQAPDDNHLTLTVR